MIQAGILAVCSYRIYRGRLDFLRTSCFIWDSYVTATHCKYSIGRMGKKQKKSLKGLIRFIGQKILNYFLECFIFYFFDIPLISAELLAAHMESGGRCMSFSTKFCQMPPTERHLALSGFTFQSRKQFEIIFVTTQLKSIEITIFLKVGKTRNMTVQQASAGTW